MPSLDHCPTFLPKAARAGAHVPQGQPGAPGGIGWCTLEWPAGAADGDGEGGGGAGGEAEGRVPGLDALLAEHGTSCRHHAQQSCSTEK